MHFIRYSGTSFETQILKREEEQSTVQNTLSIFFGPLSIQYSLDSDVLLPRNCHTNHFADVC